MPPPHVGPEIEQVRSRHAEEKEGYVLRPVGDVLDQIQECRLPPVDVVEHDDERCLAGLRLEESADGPVRLLGTCVHLDAEELGDVRAHDLLLLIVLEEGAHLGLDDLGRVEVGETGRLLHDLEHREVRDAIAVREASPSQYGRTTLEPRDELLDQSGLPNSCRPQDREQVACTIGGSTIEDLQEQGERLLASNHRRVEAPRATGRGAGDGDEAESRDGLGFALQLERLDGFDHDCITYEPVRRLADEHFARGCCLLQARRDIDRVAGHEGLLGRAGNDLAGVHADPCRERDAVLAFELLIEEFERHPHIGGGAHSSERVVLVHEWDPEHCHHRVADELLDGPPMAFDRGRHLVEVA